MSDEIYDLIKTYPSDGTGFRRMAADMISLRAQVATLTAERNKLSELWGESQTELARVKALVEGAPSEAMQWRDGDGKWHPINEKLTSHHYHDRGHATRELIARPNLEQKT